MGLHVKRLIRSLRTRDWVELLSAVILLSWKYLAKAIIKLIRWLGDVDFVVSRTQDPGWIENALQWLLHPPDWAFLLGLVFGLFIMWDALRRAQRRMQVKTSGALRVTAKETVRDPDEPQEIKGVSKETKEQPPPDPSRLRKLLPSLTDEQKTWLKRMLDEGSVPYTGIPMPFPGDALSTLQRLGFVEWLGSPDLLRNIYALRDEAEPIVKEYFSGGKE